MRIANPCSMPGFILELYSIYIPILTMYIYYYIATLLTWPNPHPVVCYDSILDLWIVKNEWMNESDPDV